MLKLLHPSITQTRGLSALRARTTADPDVEIRLADGRRRPGPEPPERSSTRARGGACSTATSLAGGEVLVGATGGRRALSLDATSLLVATRSITRQPIVQLLNLRRPPAPGALRRPRTPHLDRAERGRIFTPAPWETDLLALVERVPGPLRSPGGETSDRAEYG